MSASTRIGASNGTCGRGNLVIAGPPMVVECGPPHAPPAPRATIPPNVPVCGTRWGGILTCVNSAQMALRAVQLVAQRGSLTVTELAAELRVAKSTAHRVLANCVAAG